MTNHYLLLALLLLAAIVRLHRITGQSLWADEGNSVAQALRSLPEIAQNAAADIHPPLYYVLLHFWVRLFGTSELALRGLSALAGLLLVLLIYLVARALWGPPTARLAAVLATFHPFLVYYAQETRMYTLVALWATLAACALLHIILEEGRARLSLPDLPVPSPAATSPPLSRSRPACRPERPSRGKPPRLDSSSSETFTPPARVLPTHPALHLGRWDLLYALALAAGLWTHYAFPVLLVVLAGTYLVWVFTTRRTIPVTPRLVRLLTVHLAAVLLYLPWLPTALQRLRAWPRPTAVIPAGQALQTTLTWLSLGPVAPPSLARWAWLWLILLVVALWPWRRPGVTGYRRPHWLSWALPLLWLLAPIVMMLALHLFKPAYLKFLILAVPPFLILTARGLLAPWEVRRQAPVPRLLASAWLVVTLAVLLILNGLTLGRYYYDPAAARDDYRGIARYITVVGRPEDAVILDAPGQWDVFHYYYDGPLPVYLLPEQRPPDPARTRARLEDIARRHRTLFVLLWATDESDPERLVETWLNAHTYKALDVWRGNVRFLVYATPRSLTARALVRDLAVRLGEVIRLRRFVLLTPQAAPGDVVQVQLTWQADITPPVRYKVFLQLLGSRDQVLAQRDTEPVGGSRPTNTWPPGRPVEDNYGILIPLGTPPGRYRLIAGMYDPNTGQRLPVQQDGARRDFVELPVQVEVIRPIAPPPVEVLPIRYHNRESWGIISLLGHDRYKRGFPHAPDSPLYPGDFLHVTLYWRAEQTPGARWRVTLDLVDSRGMVVASVTDDLAGPAYPTTQWTAGEVVRGEFDLFIAPDVKPGTYGLRLQLWRGDAPAGDAVPLGTVTLRRPPGQP